VVPKTADGPQAIENPCCSNWNRGSWVKQFRAIATRYDKTAQNFLAAIYLAAATIWLN
jgi:transposase